MRVMEALRSFFGARGFLEVSTPIRIQTPPPEVHIDAVPSGGGWLRTSPELHMKRLLAAGYENLFQVGHCFRQGERGPLHHPEFTMLEWYRAHANYMDILADLRELLMHTAQQVCGATQVEYQGASLAFGPDCMILPVDEAFQRHAGWSPVSDFNPDRFDLDLVSKVEPALPRHLPVVLMDYPAPLAALARRKPGHPALAERWELYLGGVELANAYSELTDATEQRQRFMEWNKLRVATGHPAYPLDEAFLEAVEHLPPCGGIALGVDRLIMLLANASTLDAIIPFRDT